MEKNMSEKQMYQVKDILDLMHLHNGRFYLNTVFGGGAFNYLLYNSDQHPVLIADIRDQKSVPVIFLWRKKRVELRFNSLEGVLSRLDIHDIYINHLIFAQPLFDWPARLEKIIENRKLHLLIHDYFAICPSVTLLDHEGRYCEVPDAETCKVCMSKILHTDQSAQYSKIFVKQYATEVSDGIMDWRDCWMKICALTATIIFPSNATADIFARAFPSIPINKLLVVPHSIGHFKASAEPLQKEPSPVMDICLIGDISDHKGARILDRMLELTNEKKIPFRFHVLGDFLYHERHFNDPHFELHGRFAPNELSEMLTRVKPDLFMFTSIWPETFSFVIHEMISTGIPIISTNIGAHADALKGRVDATLIDDFSAHGFLTAAFDRYRVLLSEYTGGLITFSTSPELELTFSEPLGKHINSWAVTSLKELKSTRRKIRELEERILAPEKKKIPAYRLFLYETKQHLKRMLRKIKSKVVR
jgi:glycosyltransferase involved in cell wall biosynthesis